jgi:hypothetical protein
MCLGLGKIDLCMACVAAADRILPDVSSPRDYRMTYLGVAQGPGQVEPAYHHHHRMNPFINQDGVRGEGGIEPSAHACTAPTPVGSVISVEFDRPKQRNQILKTLFKQL